LWQCDAKASAVLSAADAAPPVIAAVLESSFAPDDTESVPAAADWVLRAISLAAAPCCSTEDATNPDAPSFARRTVWRRPAGHAPASRR
jgi:hypothetical protein